MISLSLIKVALQEYFSSSQILRRPEPRLVMGDDDQVIQFDSEGEPSGNLVSSYLYISFRVTELINESSLVLDLGSGSGQLLSRIARYNPQTNFIGLELSPQMIAFANERIQRQQISNMEMRHQDMSLLDGFSDKSVDAIISSLAIHHLPDLKTLEVCFKNIARVLKDDGSIFLMDFNLLKREESIEYFINCESKSPRRSLRDYSYSLRAAFPLASMKELVTRYLPKDTCVYTPFGCPFFIMILRKGRKTEPLTQDKIKQFKEAFKGMSPKNKSTFREINLSFALNGVRKIAL